MGARVNLAGQVFGRLTAVEYVAGSKWRCVCSCGGEATVQAYSLKIGNTSSCGCLQKERASASNRASIVGQRFGRLVVERFVEMVAKGSLWLCRCDCGGTIQVRADSLSTGNTSSCGCVWRERIAESNRASLAGMVFGKLTAIESVGSTPDGAVLWRCSCLCGGEKVVRSAKLSSGGVISCGCALMDRKAWMPEKLRANALIYHHRRRSLKLGGGGSFTTQQVRELMIKQRSRCACCKVKLGKKFHRDHIVPLARGGSNGIHNIQLLCPTCNFRKGAKDPIQWAQLQGRLI